MAIQLSGCKDVPDFQIVDMDPKLVLHVRLINGDQSIDINEEFTDDEGYHLKLTDLAFYVSNVHLQTVGGSSVELDDVILFDFTELNNEGVAKPFTRSYPFIIPDGNYTSLRFDLGLPADLNASDPTTFSNDDPLSGSEMYWSWATKYRFIRFGARLINDETTNFNFDMQFHTGLDTMYVPHLHYPVTFSLEAFQKDTLFVDIDWNRIFNTGDADSIVLSDKIFTHGTESQYDRDICYKFSHNFAKAISAGNP